MVPYVSLQCDFWQVSLSLSIILNQNVVIHWLQIPNVPVNFFYYYYFFSLSFSFTQVITCVYVCVCFFQLNYGQPTWTTQWPALKPRPTSAVWSSVQPPGITWPSAAQVRPASSTVSQPLLTGGGGGEMVLFDRLPPHEVIYTYVSYRLPLFTFQDIFESISENFDLYSHSE